MNRSLASLPCPLPPQSLFNSKGTPLLTCAVPPTVSHALPCAPSPLPPQVAFNPKDTNTFASASLDHTIKVWNLGQPNPNFTLEGHVKGVNCVDYFTGACSLTPRSVGWVTHVRLSGARAMHHSQLKGSVVLGRADVSAQVKCGLIALVSADTLCFQSLPQHCQATGDLHLLKPRPANKNRPS